MIFGGATRDSEPPPMARDSRPKGYFGRCLPDFGGLFVPLFICPDANYFPLPSFCSFEGDCIFLDVIALKPESNSFTFSTQSFYPANSNLGFPFGPSLIMYLNIFPPSSPSLIPRKGSFADVTNKMSRFFPPHVGQVRFFPENLMSLRCFPVGSKITIMDFISAD
jgi:hypothetical protein